MDAVDPLRSSAATAARDAGITQPRVLVAGPTAETADIKAALDRDMLVLVPLVLLIVGLVLAGLLRSLLAPLYLLATLLLSFLATLGLTVAISVGLGGDLGIGNRVTAYVFIFLVSLGVDYNIFIMSRFRQETERKAPVEALRAAITRTGGVVSSAGLILAGTFAVLMTQPIRELYQFGMAMAIGILPTRSSSARCWSRQSSASSATEHSGRAARTPAHRPRNAPHPQLATPPARVRMSRTARPTGRGRWFRCRGQLLGVLGVQDLLA